MIKKIGKQPSLKLKSVILITFNQNWLVSIIWQSTHGQLCSPNESNLTNQIKSNQTNQIKSKHMALGHIAPGAITMPKKYQKYIQKYIPKYTNKSCIYLYVFGYTWLYFGIFSAWLWHQKKYQKYIQIYPRYTQDIQDKYKIPSGRRPGPAQARPKPGAAHGPARDPRPRGPGLGPGLGLARAGGRLVFWIYFIFCRLQLKRGLFSYFFTCVLQLYSIFIWFLIDVN